MVAFHAMHRLLALHVPQVSRLAPADRNRMAQMPLSSRSMSPGRSLVLV
jgi:hypothetical protein